MNIPETIIVVLSLCMVVTAIVHQVMIKGHDKNK